MSQKIHNALPPLEPLLVEITTLHHDPTNARLHNKRNLESIKSSLNAFGQHQPIVVQEQGMIVRVGNGRLMAAKELGWTHIAAIVVEEDNIQAVGRALADNKTSDLADWDYGVLGDLFKALKADDFDLELTGFATYEFEPILQVGFDPPEVDPSGDPFEHKGEVRLSPSALEKEKSMRTMIFDSDQWEKICKSTGGDDFTHDIYHTREEMVVALLGRMHTDD